MQEIFSEKVVTSRRTYYFDVKETREGATYLVIGELTQVGSELERHRVMVFEESVEAFMEGIEKAVSFMLGYEEEDGERSAGRAESRRAEEENGETEEIRRLKRIERKLDEVRRHFR